MEKILHIDSRDKTPSADKIDITNRAADLLSLRSGDLAPLFWPPSRPGVDSAWYAHVPFAHWLISRIKPGLVVELGVHNGVSYAAFCEAVARLRLPTACFAVDSWKGDEHSGFYGEEVYEDLVRFNSARYASFSELLRCSFDEAAPYFADQSIDLLHLDGFHTYEAVKHDFETWLPKLSKNAVVLLHDTNVRKLGFGAWRVFLELKQRYPAFEFLHAHGLGLLAVGAEVSPALTALCSLDEDAINSIRECFATMGEHWARGAADGPAPASAGQRPDGRMQAISSLETSLQEAYSRIGVLEASVREAGSRSNAFEASLQEAYSRIGAVEASVREAGSRSSAFETSLQEAYSRIGALEASVREATARSNGLELLLKEAYSRIDAPASAIEMLKAELLAMKRDLEEKRKNRLGRILGWKNYEAAYQEWKKYKKKRIDKQSALENIDYIYGIYPFFLFYPVYKTLKPLVKCKRSLARKILPGRMLTQPQGNVEAGGSAAPVVEPNTCGVIPRVSDLSARAFRVVYISGEPDTPGHVYRIVRYVESLSAAGVQTTWLRVDELENRLAEITGTSLLVIWRASYGDAVERAVATARSSGAKILFDVDDLMVDPELAQVGIIDGIRSMNLNEKQVVKHFKKVQKTMALADFCSAPTQELATHLRKCYLPAFVLPNGYDQNTYSASRLAVRKRRKAASDGLVRIGYATGSRTHQADFAVAADAVARILRECPHCRLVLFNDELTGPVLVPEEFPQLEEVAGQIEWRSLVPVGRLPEELARFDINLAPLLVGNPFCEAKSELKYFEAALVEVPTIASPTGPFRRAIRHGSTGFLAAQASEWYEALRRLVDDAELRHRVGKAAYHDVIWPYGPLRRTQMMHAALLQSCGNARLAAQAFELELHRSKPGRVQEPIIIADSDVVFEYDQLGHAEVTVIVPLYNYAHYVEEALDSVFDQSLDRLDLIVVDDKSTDDSLNTAVMWAKGHKERFNRVIVLANKSNSGLGPTRNAGFDAADTSFILPLDADNRLKPNCCETCLKKIKESGAAFIYPLIQTFGDDCKITGGFEYHPARFIGGNYIDAMSLISKEAWAAAGGYGHFQVLGWEDFEFWCRLVELGLWGCRSGDAPLADYRVHGHSMLQKITDLPHNKKRLVEDMKSCHPWLNLV